MGQRATIASTGADESDCLTVCRPSAGVGATGRLGPFEQQQCGLAGSATRLLQQLFVAAALALQQPQHFFAIAAGSLEQLASDNGAAFTTSTTGANRHASRR